MRTTGLYIATLWTCSTLFTLTPHAAHAGPIELFDGIDFAPSDPNTLAVRYMYGASGLLVSHDQGKTLSLVCSRYADPSLKSDRATSLVSGSGVLHLAGFTGLWTSDDKGCNFTAASELSGKFVAALGVDPTDPKRVYAGTASGGDAPVNGLFTNDGVSAAWTPFGKQGPEWIQSLHIVKTATGKRFWETAVSPDMKTDPSTGMVSYLVHYVARYSEDDAKTWKEAEYTPLNQFGGAEDTTAKFHVVAVDPKNPDHIFAIVERGSQIDDFVYSPSRGEAGTWKLLAQPTQFGGMAFTPDGKLYFGDYDQTSLGLFVMDTLETSPRKLPGEWGAGCLGWDAKQEKMFACNRWLFGTVDLESGDFTQTYDMRCGQTLEDCPGLQEACAEQLKPNWCDPTHYPAAPLCSGYDIPQADYYVQNVLDYDCKDGKAVPRPEGAAGASGAAAVGGMSGGSASAAAGVGGSAAKPPVGGGSSASAGSKATAAGSSAASGNTGNTSKSDSGGGCSAAGAAEGGTAWLALGLFGLCWRRRSSRPTIET